MTPHTEELFAKLGMNYKQEKSQVRIQLAELMDRLGQFELQKIASGGYIHFMHLLSQVVLSTTQPIRCGDELVSMLPLT